MNPDGSVRGNLRTNAAGANLNREWLDRRASAVPKSFTCAPRCRRPASTRSSTSTATKALPYVFTDGNERLPTYTPRMAALERGFADALVAANPDFQTVHGYPANKDTKVNLTVASKWVGHTYGGLGIDAGDAVQGQRRPAGSGARLERRAVAPAGRRHADGALRDAAVAVTAALSPIVTWRAGVRRRFWWPIRKAAAARRRSPPTSPAGSPASASAWDCWTPTRRAPSTQWLARRPALFPPVAGFAGDVGKKELKDVGTRVARRRQSRGGCTATHCATR